MVKEKKLNAQIMTEDFVAIETRYRELLEIQKQELDMLERSVLLRKQENKEQYSRENRYSRSDSRIASDFGNVSKSISTAEDQLNVFDETLKRVSKRTQGFSAELIEAFELGAFAEEGFGKAIESGVKRAIAALASEAFVRSIMETAAGFASLANPLFAPLAPFHFKAAALYGLVGGGALVGGAAVMSGSATASNPQVNTQVSGYGSQQAGGSASQSQPTEITINITGAAASERDLAEAVYEGLKKARKYRYI